MRLADVSLASVSRHLAGQGLSLRLGPFVVRIRSKFPEMARWMHWLYARQRLSSCDFADFHVRLASPVGLRSVFRPQTLFSADGLMPFHPLPRAQVGPSFEWGLNWCIATRAHQYLIFHAAVLERNGCAVLLPGDPGAGKSTLCAALAYNGWRLLTDELGLLSPETGELFGLARPVNLKNASIDIIRRHLPGARMSDACHDTSKGSVALLAPSDDSVDRVDQPARPRWVVTPQYDAASPPSLQPHSRATTFMELAHNSFNYSVLGLSGFHALERMVDRCECYHFQYSSLDDAIRVFDELAAGA